jgi:hypothetical protein
MRVRTTITISPELLKECRLAAASQQLTLSGLIEKALKALITKAEPEDAEAPPFKLVTVKGKPLPPEIDLDRTSALLAAEDQELYGGKAD